MLYDRMSRRDKTGVEGREKRTGFNGASERIKERVQRNSGSCRVELSLKPLDPRTLEPFLIRS
jgi:hypothetical protein